MRAMLAAALALTLAAPAHALTVKGISPERSLRENVKLLEARDWHCERMRRAGSVQYRCARAEGLPFQFGITIGNDWVLYSCAVFDACNTEATVFADALSRARELPAFQEYERRCAGNDDQALRCARSADGVAACIESYDGMTHSLQLRLARFDPARFD